METVIENRDLDGLKEVVKAEKKTAKDDEFVLLKVDGFLKKRGFKVAEQPSATKEELARRHFHFVMNCSKLGLCSKNTPLSTLQDLLEMSSIEECKQIFSIVEENMNEFKQPGFIETAQNNILRFCNDLLRRLSRTAETSFCGRIMFFLSRFLPLTEKSGVNFMGHFNTLNVTNYDESETDGEALLAATSSAPTPTEGAEDMETGEIEEDNSKEIQVTPEMYRQFWSLQKFMSNPNSIYEKEKFLTFKTDLTAVLTLMTSNKLEKLSSEEEEALENRQKKQQKGSSNDVFFTKYLTSPKLLALQLNDSSFRRYFLMQAIIIFQYLTAESRFKPPAKKMVLNEDQAKYVSECEDKCYRLLADTMPRGTAFVAGLKRIMLREQEWNTWKNANCADFSEKADKGAMQMYKKRQRIPFNPNSLDLGTPELTKLWTNEPDVLKACKSDKRKFIPKLPDFIRDPIDEMDPEQQVEEQYKQINDSAFQWRAARLLMHKSPGYVTKTDTKTDPTTNIKEFLERNMYNAAKNFNEFKESIENREKKEAEARKKVEESLKRKLDSSKVKPSQTSSPNPYTDTILSDEHLTQLARDLSKFKSNLAKCFGTKLPADDVTSDEKICFKILKSWAEKNGRSGRSLLNTLITDLDVIEVAQASMKVRFFSEKMKNFSEKSF
ncbi:Death domain-containing protein [Caenorhabditis elegans]|uniref:Death domain-containing protein n=1 Tax=Caenorhabditis elegans TaxID=6239 RepID=Q9N5E3_CAEEL|nr:Death domain-containing protein [Caenorhabditis elegans]CCD73573.1 Death domain-containing protein [Caenorhabditis elegans]|eukprot:NP_493796.2 THO Complex (transcription factor/nuclear export) subunit [Caenorhabditis elegans]